MRMNIGNRLVARHTGGRLHVFNGQKPGVPVVHTSTMTR